MTLLDFEKHGNLAYHNVVGVYSHISDPNEKRRLVLAEIDKSPSFGWYHVRQVMMTGVGLFTDTYSVSLLGCPVPS